ncbi:MAG: CopG family antitoxin [Candidatus Microgenomates bacterium]|jgi:predicted DNA binding CopG/RHH family protein
MKYYELTKDERTILKDFEKGTFVSVSDFKKAKKLYEKIAKNTLNKTKNINIRLSERVIARLRAKAAEEGIPYQTLASSVLHKYASQ